MFSHLSISWTSSIVILARIAVALPVAIAAAAFIILSLLALEPELGFQVVVAVYRSGRVVRENPVLNDERR